MDKQKCLILGQAYSFADLKLTLWGVEMFSPTAIVAKVTQEKKNNPGMGTKPASRGRGIEVFDVSFDLSEKDVQRLTPLAPGGMLHNLPPTPGILLGDNGTDKVEFTLTAFEFQTDGVDTAVEDTELKQSFVGICAGIQRRILT